MIDRASFAEGLSFLGVALRQTITEAELEAYYELIREETDARAWKAWTREAAASNRWQFLPRAGEILEALHEPLPQYLIGNGQEIEERRGHSPLIAQEYILSLPRAALDYRLKSGNLKQGQFDEILRIRRERREEKA